VQAGILGEHGGLRLGSVHGRDFGRLRGSRRSAGGDRERDRHGDDRDDQQHHERQEVAIPKVAVELVDELRPRHGAGSALEAGAGAPTPGVGVETGAGPEGVAPAVSPSILASRSS
jgi:hypothetical protein